MPEKVHKCDAEVVDEEKPSVASEIMGAVSVDYEKIGRVVGERLGSAVKKGVTGVVDGLLKKHKK